MYKLLINCENILYHVYIILTFPVTTALLLSNMDDILQNGLVSLIIGKFEQATT